MGSKRVLPEFQIVGGTTGVDGTMIRTVTVTSVPTNIKNLDNIGFQIAWTGDAAGTLEIQCSIDGVTYYPLSFDPPILQPSGTEGGYLINLTELPYPWIQLKYRNASGTGNLSAWICGKDIN